MTQLEKIDARLSLYPEYLRYWLDRWIPYFTIDLSLMPQMSPFYLFRMYQQTGILFYTTEHYEQTLTFDEWLVKNGHEGFAQE